MDFKQNADGSISTTRERDSAEITRTGASSGPAGSNAPSYGGHGVIVFNVAGGTDTGGGILSWKNTLGYDIVVIGAVLDVTTKSTGACTVSLGQTPTSGTTSSSNFISGKDVGTATGTFNGGALSVKVAVNTWITASQATGASAGLLGRVAASYYRSNPTVGGA